MTSFEGQTILITGAATGIGRSTARKLADLGARLVIVDLNGDGAIETAAALPGNARGYRCDVRSDADVDALRDRVLADCGGVDILVNNAAKPPVTGPLAETDIEVWRDALDVNVLGYVRMIRAFLPHMIARGTGRIVNTSSGLALLPDPPTRFMGPYIASKGAQLAMSYAFAHALADTGVTLSVFCPGLTATSDRPGGPPPAGVGAPTLDDFRRGVPERRARPATADHAAQTFVDGLLSGAFLTCSQEGYHADLVDFATANLDPYSIVRQAHAEAA